MQSKNIDSSTRIKQKAIELGFAACGITQARKLHEEEAGLKAYLEANYNGRMAYMANHFEKRLDPTLLVTGAKTVIVVLLNYFPRQLQNGKEAPIISKYAYGTDYHVVLKDKLKQLYNYIEDNIAPLNGRIFTDSAPVLERAWAVQAGLGWIGKNGLLLNKKMGSFIFIGEIICDLELPYDQPYKDEHCGSCTQCLSACPTGALFEPYKLDSRKCISYLTIELKDEIPPMLRPKLMRRAFGCDICQDVCPWNRKAKAHNTEAFNPHARLLEMSKEEWQNLSPEQFNELFGKSAIKRAGYKKMMKNISH